MTSPSQQSRMPGRAEKSPPSGHVDALPRKPIVLAPVLGGVQLWAAAGKVQTARLVKDPWEDLLTGQEEMWARMGFAVKTEEEWRVKSEVLMQRVLKYGRGARQYGCLSAPQCRHEEAGLVRTQS